MLKVALLSKWHVHWIDYMKEALNNPLIEIVRIWDEDQVRGETWAADLGVPFEPDLDLLITDTAIDAIIVTTATNAHKELILKAAENGKHIFTEKVLAFSVEDCKAIYDAVERNGVQLMVSLPRLVEPYYLVAQEAVDQGLLGEINTIRFRVAHNGAVSTDLNPNGWLPQHFYDPDLCGGGAFIDLGAHPIYLTNRLGGKAKTVSAHFIIPEGKKVDVHALVVVEYESGALGILETGFTSGANLFLMELHGTQGTILIEPGRVRRKMTGGEWEEVRLPERLPMPMEQWAKAILEGSRPSIGKDDAIELTLINEAASESNLSGSKVNVLQRYNW